MLLRLKKSNEFYWTDFPAFICSYNNNAMAQRKQEKLRYNRFYRHFNAQGYTEVLAE